MANVTLHFNCSSGDGFYLETYLNEQNEISVVINNPLNEPNVVLLDKSTAIKFAKTLRTEINKIIAREEGRDV